MKTFIFLTIASVIQVVVTRLYPDWIVTNKYTLNLEVWHGISSTTHGKSPSSGYELGSAVRTAFFNMSTLFFMETSGYECYLTHEDMVAPDNIFPTFTGDMVKTHPMSQWNIEVSESRDTLHSSGVLDLMGYDFYHAFFPHVKDMLEGDYTIHHSIYVEGALKQVRDLPFSLTPWDGWGEFAPVECNPLYIAGTGVSESQAPVYKKDQFLTFRASLNAPQCTVDGVVPCGPAKWGIFYKDQARCQMYQRFDDEYFYEQYSPSLNNQDQAANLWKTLTFDPNILKVGTYMLLLSEVDDPNLPACKFYAQGYFHVIEPGLSERVDPREVHTLETILDGSDVRLTLPIRKTLYLSAVHTYDPYGLVIQDEMVFKWRCVQLGTNMPCNFFLWYPEGHKGPMLDYKFKRIPNFLVHFTVQPLVRGRTGPVKSKIIEVVDYHIVQAIISGYGNMMEKIIPGMDLLLHVSWHKPLDYSWGVARRTDMNAYVNDSNWLPCCPMGINLDTLWLTPGCLIQGETYKFFVVGYDTLEYTKAKAEYIREVATEIVPGTCDIQPRFGVSVETTFTVQCDGFISPDQLKYSLYRGDVLVFVSYSSMFNLTLAPGTVVDNYTISDFRLRVSTSYGMEIFTDMSPVEVLMPDIESPTFWRIFQSGITFGFAVDAVMAAINMDDVTERIGDRIRLREEAMALLLEEPQENLDDLLLMSWRLLSILNTQAEISDTILDQGLLISQLLSEHIFSVPVSSVDGHQMSSRNILLGCEALTRRTTSQINQMKQSAWTGQQTLDHSQLDKKNQINQAIVRIVDTKIERMTKYFNMSEPIKTDTLLLDVQKKSTSVSGLQFNHSTSTLVLPDLPLTGFIELENELYTGEEVYVQMLYMEKSPYTWNTIGPDSTSAMMQLSLTTEDLVKLDVYFLPEPVNIFLNTNADVSNVSLSDIYLFPNTSSIEIIEIFSRSDRSIILRFMPQGNFSVLAYLGENTEHFTKELITDQGTIFPRANDALETQGDLTEDPNLWIVPECVGCDQGGQLLYLAVMVTEVSDLELNDTSYGFAVGIQQIEAACLYWNPVNEFWASDGCEMTRFTNMEQIHCKCNHLTAFSANFLVMPNLVNPMDTVALFSTFFDNPVVVVTVLVIWFLYGVLLLFVHKLDREDWIKIGAVDLPDNEPTDTYGYLVGMVTGWWIGAGTTANVYFSIQGSHGVSKKHALIEPSGRQHFQSGMEDWFIVRTPRSLGTLKYVTVWHDNWGSSPAWFLKQVSVQDIQKNDIWHFLYNHWLDIQRGPTHSTKVTLQSIDSNEFAQKSMYQLSLKSSKDFRTGHLWFSIFTKPPASSFTRVQRLTCGLVLLLTTMLTSLMFHGIPTDDPEDQLQKGDLHISFSSLIIGIECGLIMIPITLIVVELFSRTAPPTAEDSDGEIGATDHRHGVSLFERWKQKRQFGFNFDLDLVEKMEKGEKVDIKKTSETKKKAPFMFPSWFLYVAWTVSLLVAVICSYFVMLYGLMYGYQQSLVWFVSFFTAFFQSNCVEQPLRVIVVALLVTILLKRPVEIETYGPLPSGPELEEADMTETERGMLKVKAPPDSSSRFKLLEILRIEERTQELVKELVVYFTFVVVLMLVVYGHRNIDQSFLYTNTVSDMLINGAYEDTLALEEVSTVEDMWEYLQTSVLETTQPGEDNLARDRVSFLVGRIRLRQKRLQSGECEVPEYLARYYLHNRCVGQFDSGIEETNDISNSSSYWKYKSALQLNALPYTGEHGTYSGGGFIVDLPKDEELSAEIIEELQAVGWVGQETRAVFVELALYNANVNIFSIVLVLFEFTSVGQIYTSSYVFASKLYHYSNEFETFVAACEIIFIFYILIFINTEIKKMRKYGKAYLRDTWSYVECAIILLSISGVGLFINRMLLVDLISAEYRDSDGETFINFYLALFWDFVLVCDVGFLVLLTILKFLKLFRFNRRTAMLSETLARAKSTILTYAVAILCLLTAYAHSGYIVFGRYIEEYRSIGRSLMTMFNFGLGDSDLLMLIECSEVLGPIFFFLGNITIIHIFINLFVSSIIFFFQDTRTDVNKIKCEVKMVKYMIAYLVEFVPFREEIG